MEQELQKLKEVLDEKRIDVNSKKSKRWNAANKKPLSMIEGKYVNDPSVKPKSNPLNILKNHINNGNIQNKDLDNNSNFDKYNKENYINHDNDSLPDLTIDSKKLTKNNANKQEYEQKPNFSNEVIMNMYQNQNNPFIKNIIENFEKNKKTSNLTDPEINNIREVLKFEKMEEYLSLLKTNLDSFDQFLNLTDINLTQIGIKLGHRIKILRSITKYNEIINSHNINENLNISDQNYKNYQNNNNNKNLKQNENENHNIQHQITENTNNNNNLISQNLQTNQSNNTQTSQPPKKRERTIRINENGEKEIVYINVKPNPAFDGEFDEEKNKQEFQDALNQVRNPAETTPTPSSTAFSYEPSLLKPKSKPKSNPNAPASHVEMNLLRNRVDDDDTDYSDMPELIEEECDIPKRSKMYEYGSGNFSISDCVIFSELCIGNDDEMDADGGYLDADRDNYSDVNIINSNLVDIVEDDEVLDENYNDIEVSKERKNKSKGLDPVDEMMNETKVSGEKLNQLNDWMDDIYCVKNDNKEEKYDSEQLAAFKKLEDMDIKYNDELNKLEKEYEVDDIDLDVDTEKFNFDYDLYE
eukprot:Mrub_02200.p1 GENE.Mrub_02200~~Mrub_02200.p1  ORF type:complete len:594 (+),score=163.70 Mrub_02200:33-1784(+)